MKLIPLSAFAVTGLFSSWVISPLVCAMDFSADSAHMFNQPSQDTVGGAGHRVSGLNFRSDFNNVGRSALHGGSPGSSHMNSVSYGASALEDDASISDTFNFEGDGLTGEDAFHGAPANFGKVVQKDVLSETHCTGYCASESSHSDTLVKPAEGGLVLDMPSTIDDSTNAWSNTPGIDAEPNLLFERFADIKNDNDSTRASDGGFNSGALEQSLGITIGGETQPGMRFDDFKSVSIDFKESFVDSAHGASAALEARSSFADNFLTQSSVELAPQ